MISLSGGTTVAGDFLLDLGQCNHSGTNCLIVGMSDVHRLPEKWLPVSIAPADTSLEVGVLDKRGDVVALVYPVRKIGVYWVDAVSKKIADISPTHWRPWNDGR